MPPFARRVVRLGGCALARGLACGVVPALLTLPLGPLGSSRPPPWLWVLAIVAASTATASLLELGLARSKARDLAASLLGLTLGVAAGALASVQLVHAVAVLRGQVEPFAFAPPAAGEAALLGLVLSSPFALAAVASGECRRRRAGLALTFAIALAPLLALALLVALISGEPRPAEGWRLLGALVGAACVSGGVALQATLLVAFVDALFGRIAPLQQETPRAAYWAEPSAPP